VNRIHSFPFSADERSRILILGSMPGVESLTRQEYYAHPRNLFWELMGEMFGADRTLPHDQRLAILRDHHIAVWDVAHSCQREGSLDSNMTGVIANDFESLFDVAPEIHTLFFNGQKAATLFNKLVLPSFSRDVTLVPLPSTSPANASMTIEKKQAAWEQLRSSL
jgi:double-stranded uracil-DNA glycosylase